MEQTTTLTTFYTTLRWQKKKNPHIQSEFQWLYKVTTTNAPDINASHYIG